MSEDTKDVYEYLQQCSPHSSGSFKTEDGSEWRYYPNWMHFKCVDDKGTYIPKPRIVAGYSFVDQESFIDYINKYKQPDTFIRAIVSENEVNAIIDYHGAEGQGKPDICQHEATLKLKRSIEFKTWMDIHGKWLEQTEFAEFIEENYQDISKPESATIIEIVNELKVTNNVHFDTKVQLAKGIHNFQYTENHDTQTNRGSMQVPNQIEIGIPVFMGMDAFAIPVFFRYRIRDKKLQFCIKVMKLDNLLFHSIKKVAEQIEEKTELKVYLS